MMLRIFVIVYNADPLKTSVLNEVFSSLVPLRFLGSENVPHVDY